MTMPDNQAVIKDIVESIRQLYRAVYQDASKVGRQFGLTASQSGVLRCLFNFGPLSSADLSRKLFVTPSNITGIIDRLEKKQLVERVKKVGDRRVALITLTDEGLEISQMLPDPIERKLINGLAHLDTDRVERLRAAMEQILTLVDADDLRDAPLDISQIGAENTGILLHD
jgi:DNA-binding MarR family transcriptional regulator